MGNASALHKFIDSKSQSKAPFEPLPCETVFEKGSAEAITLCRKVSIHYKISEDYKFNVLYHADTFKFFRPINCRIFVAGKKPLDPI
jgi:hypothetical protein